MLPVDSETRVHGALAHNSRTVESGRLFGKAHPRHQWLAKWYDRWMVLVALIASLIVYLQAAMILSNKNSENVSLPSLVMALIVALSVLGYGVLWGDTVLAGAGIIGSVGCVFALVVTVAYRPASPVGAFAL